MAVARRDSDSQLGGLDSRAGGEIIMNGGCFSRC